MAALSACSKCNSRHPLEELSPGQQLCKDCRCALPLVKCTFCRTEFQGSSKGGTAACAKCESNVKVYGKPSACEYCNIIAAFIGAKCQRCTNSEKKYGAPITCEQCKQRCAFDRKDADSRKKVDGKLLCWLCTLSYKRALAKAKQKSSSRHNSSMSQSGSHRHSSHNHKHSHSHSHSSNSKSKKTEKHISVKKPKSEQVTKTTNGTSAATSDSTLLDPNISDHVVAMTQLKDQIASLQKQLKQKDQEIIAVDQMEAEIRDHHSLVEQELRHKIQSMTKSHEDLVDELQSKVRFLQTQITTLNTQVKAKGIDSPQR